jgi:hypothetical protein
MHSIIFEEGKQRSSRTHLRNESRLGEKTALLLLGLAVGGNLDRELGSVLQSNQG